jgi:hypothetical protein
MHPSPNAVIVWHEQQETPRVPGCGHCVLSECGCHRAHRLPRRTAEAESNRAEKGTTMFCNNSCNNGIWLIILIIILFGWGGNGCGCNNNCGCNNCGCDNNCGCNNGCC